MSQRVLRFGLKHNGKYSQYWSVHTVARRDDVYLAAERTGDTMHLSFHEDDVHWHLKVTRGGESSISQFQRPLPVLPSITRGVQVVIPPGAARYDSPRRPDRKVVWVTVSDGEQWACFNIFFEKPGADPDWRHHAAPGGSEIGVLRQVSGGCIRVIAWSRPGASGSLTSTPGADELEAARDAIQRGSAYIIIHGTNGDGSISLIEMTAEPLSQPTSRPL